MKLHYVNFIYLGPRKEVNLDSPLLLNIQNLHLLFIIAFLKIYLLFSSVLKKKEYF